MYGETLIVQDLYVKDLSKILSLQNIETMKFYVFITVVVMRYRPRSFHKPDFFFFFFFLIANNDYLALAIRFLSKLGVFSQ